MTHDDLKRLHLYLPKGCAQAVGEFLVQASAEMREGYYPIMGERVFAKVMSYPTSIPEECRIEAHDRYVDIQATLLGGEGISVFPRERLDIRQPYSKEEDVVFFHPKPECRTLYAANLPGAFTMLFPHEAHRPQERIPGCAELVKKFVIKMEVSLWQTSSP